MRYYVILFVMLGCAVVACKKSNGTGGLASLTIINADASLSSAYVYFTYTDTAFYAQQNLISYASAMEYGVMTDSTSLSLYNSTDTVKPSFRDDFVFKPGGIYSLYLCGSGSIPDTVFTQDVIPIEADSNAAARFVDLCPDCGSLNVTQQGGNQSDISALTYKQVAGFKSYSANSAVLNNGGYNYLITDGYGNQIATFNWNPQPLKSNTLVICGVDSLQTVQIFSVNNY